MSVNKYTVSSSPHIRSKDTVQGIMGDVFIALLLRSNSRSMVF